MGYTQDDSMVRVDFFNPRSGGGGKWYCTEAVKWLIYDSTHDQHGAPQEGGKLLEDAFREALDAHFGDRPRLNGMLAVCLEPYHQHGHPITMMVGQ